MDDMKRTWLRSKDMALVSGVTLGFLASGWLFHRLLVPMEWGALWAVLMLTLMLLIVLVVVLAAVQRLSAEQHVSFRKLRLGQFDLYWQIESLQAIYRLLDITEPLPPMRRFALSPDAARELVLLMRKRQPEFIVEASSGVSTILAAYCLRQLGRGKVISLEHDAHYAEQTRQDLVRHGVSEWAEVVHAPLVDQQIGSRSSRWYDLSGVTLPERVDLLVVDGPPRYLQELTRYPAIPAMKDRLAPDAVVFVDDYADGGEKESVRLWCQEDGPFHVVEPRAEKGLAILYRQNPGA